MYIITSFRTGNGPNEMLSVRCRRDFLLITRTDVTIVGTNGF